ncbi:ead/Ea22-like family protein [Nocardioides kribbensis]|uniref:Ead/Ea22-like family protein n=1 Tax=Nocardioides kribbensis TaxID=305517 RepID=A0ABV1NZ43_9ACTN
MSDQIQRLREVAEAATEGPWVDDQDAPASCVYSPTEDTFVTAPFDWNATGSDTRYIATFDPPTVLELLARLERAEAAVERVREVVERRLVYMSSADAHVIHGELTDALDGGER